MQNLYLSRAVVACFEGESVDGASPLTPDASSPAIAAAQSAAAAGALTQELFNKALAEDRRKHQAKLEKTIEDVQARASLTAAEHEQLAEQLEDLRKEGRTKDAQLAHEKKQLEADYERKLKAERKERERWESQYRSETTERALLDAAVSGDAFNTDTLAAVLRPMTSLSEIMDEKTGKGTGRFRPTVEFPDTDPNTGESIVVQHTPQSAVKRMKELPKYVNLFKSGVVSGAGANSGGLAPGANGKIDVRAATANMETYMAIRSSRPEQLGLRPLKKGQHR